MLIDDKKNIKITDELLLKKTLAVLLDKEKELPEHGEIEIKLRDNKICDIFVIDRYRHKK